MFPTLAGAGITGQKQTLGSPLVDRLLSIYNNIFLAPPGTAGLALGGLEAVREEDGIDRGRSLCVCGMGLGAQAGKQIPIWPLSGWAQGFIS